MKYFKPFVVAVGLLLLIILGFGTYIFLLGIYLAIKAALLGTFALIVIGILIYYVFVRKNGKRTV